MREIKFRAWDKTSRCWTTDIVHHTDMSNRILHLKSPTRDPSFQVEIMQFTGLLDKNGKEIYEGDILHLRCGAKDGVSSNSNITATVVWEDCRFRAAIHDREVKVKGGTSDGKLVSLSTIHSWVGMHTCLSEHSAAWGNLEVIGNIYENKELIKETK